MYENGFVLLTSTIFDNQKLINDLESDWQLVAESVELQGESFSFSINGLFCALSVMPAPIPNGEADYYAKRTYYCTEAIDIAKKHQAHLMVTVMNQGDASIVECMAIYSKVVASCLKQETAIGVYTSSSVFSADFYRQTCQKYLPHNEVPVMLWVYIGFGQSQQGNQLYTAGMEKFQKQEMEILDSEDDLQTLLTMMTGLCGHMIKTDMTLRDGETFGFSADQKWAIRQSKSVNAPSDLSLKLHVGDVSAVAQSEKASNIPTSGNNLSASNNESIKNQPSETSQHKKTVNNNMPVTTHSSGWSKIITGLLAISTAIFALLYFNAKKETDYLKSLHRQEITKAYTQAEISARGVEQTGHEIEQPSHTSETVKTLSFSNAEYENELITFPVSNNTLKKRLGSQIVIPERGFQAYFIRASQPNTIAYQQVFNDIEIDFSYDYQGIKSKDFIGYWIGKIDIAEDGYYQFPLEYSWADVKVSLDEYEIVNKTTHAPNKAQPVYLKKGEYLLQVEYRSHWHTVDFSMGFQKVSGKS